MKKHITSILILLIGCTTFSFAQNYYYAPEGKAFLKVSTKKVLIQFEAGTPLNVQQRYLLPIPEVATLTKEMLLPSPVMTLLDLEKISSEEQVYELIERLKKLERVRHVGHFLAHKDGTLHGVTKNVLVRLKNSSDVDMLRNISKGYKATVDKQNEFDPLLYHVSIDVSAEINALALANKLHETGLFDYAEPDFLRLMKRMNTNDPFVGNQWSLENTGANTSQYGGIAGADMKVFDAWSTTVGSSGIKVAILDEGVDLTHPDLTPNLLGGYDATGQNSGGAPQEDDAHGTACAGIVAAVGNNSEGVAGVAYGSKIIPVRIAYSSGPNWITSNTWIGNAINWSWDNAEADILSNSWGGGGSSNTINNAISNAVNSGRGGLGSPVLFAAGNDNGANSYPATYSPTISVIAMSMCNERKNPSSCDGETWWGSNYGNGADIAAPGVKIYATDISGSAGYTSGDYVSNFNGTSSACPNAAGVMALILSADGSLTESEARAALEGTCDKVGGYTYNSNVGGQPNGTWSTELGYGRVNAAAALASVAPSSPNDAGISSITTPSGLICATTADPVVVLRNSGSNTLTSVNINYQVDGGSISTYNWSGSLSSTSSTNITLPTLNFSSGAHTFTAYTSSPNGQSDSNTANDNASSNFTSGTNDVTLTITLDNYPEETSWDIRDGSNNLIASGGTYGTSLDGSTIVENICLPDGCFDFTIYDAYGDGICCGFGNGSYTLTEDASGATLASGGNFGSSETTNFCLTGPLDPLEISITGSSNVSCGATDNGSTTAAATGGTGNYTFSWSNGANGSTASGLGAGVYGVTVNDGNSTASTSVTITDPNSTYYADTDGDGFGDAGSTTRACSLPAGYVTNSNDCDDGDGGVYPGAPEICDGIDNDCDGQIDEGLGQTTYYADTDGDGYGDPNNSTTACVQPGGYVSNSGDCDDNDFDVNPDATEVCDGIDNDCDGQVDEGFSQNTYYADTDGDGYGDPGASITDCTQPAGYVSNSGDCDDTNSAVNPDAVEVCDGIDNNCDGQTDDNGCAGCTYATIDFNDFESGWGIWNDGGSDCRRSSNDAAYANSGVFCVRLRDNTSTSVMTTNSDDLSSYDELTVSFSFVVINFNGSEDFWLQISTNGGSSFTTIQSWVRNVDFVNGQRYNESVVIPGPFTANTQIRFRADASGNGDRLYIDDVEISGCSTGSAGGLFAGFSEPEKEPFVEPDQTIEVDLVSDIKVFPNPTNRQLFVDFNLREDVPVKFLISDVAGKVHQLRQVEGHKGYQRFGLDATELAAGIYWMHLITSEGRISKRFAVIKD